MSMNVNITRGHIYVTRGVSEYAFTLAVEDDSETSSSDPDGGSLGDAAALMT